MVYRTNMFKKKNLRELIEFGSIYQIKKRIDELSFIHDKYEIIKGLEAAVKNNDDEIISIVKSKFDIVDVRKNLLHYACEFDKPVIARVIIPHCLHFTDDIYINTALENSKKISKLLVRNNTKITKNTLKKSIVTNNLVVFKKLHINKNFNTYSIGNKLISLDDVYDLFSYAIKHKNKKAMLIFIKNKIKVSRRMVMVAENTNDEKIISLIYRYYNE